MTTFNNFYKNMPIYEYKCRKCGTVFEVLTFGTSKTAKKPACTKCSSRSVVRLVSSFAPVRGGTQSACACRKNRACGCGCGGAHCCG